MKIAMFSELSYSNKGIEWFRGGKEISYAKNKSVNLLLSTTKQCSVLTFDYEFEYDFDTVYMAFSEPYTFTTLQKYLKSISDSPQTNSYCSKEILCYSILGNPCYLLTITDRKSVV